MIKKLTSILLVVMLLATLTPGVIFAADTTESIPFDFAIDTSAGGNSSKVQANGRLFARGGTHENLRHTYISFDLSGYEAKILAASEINLVLYCTRYSEEAAQNFNVYLLPDGKAKFVNSELTYDIAVSNSMATGGELVASNSTKMSQYTYYTSGDMASYLKNAIAESSDSKVAFRIDGRDTLPQSFVVSGHSLSVKYDDTAVDDQSFVTNVANSLDWSHISTQSQDNVTENLTLPSKLYGADVTWTSTDDAITSDGTVTAPKGDAKEVTLTANFNYNGATASKPFTVIVPATPAKSETVSYSQRAHIRGGANAGNVQGISSEVYTCKQTHGTDNDRYAFYQFNLLGYEDKIENATKATLTIKGENATEAFTASLLADKCDSWSSATLTYNLANELGMLSNSSNSTDLQSGITLEANTEYTTSNFADSLRAAITDNPTNSIVTFRLYADTSTVVILKRATVQLNLEYYEENLNTNALFEAKKDSLAWDDITTQSIDNVTEDLTLPTKLYGFNVTWESDSAVIDASTGKVTQLKTGDTKVKLTATITNGSATHSKVFEVTVPAPVKSSLVLDYADWAITRGLNQETIKSEGYGWVYARKAGLNDDNDRYIYYSFDLSGNEEKIMKASDVNLSFKPDSVSGGTWQLSILPATTNKWTHDTLTYGMSNALGMMDDATVIQSGVKVNAGETYTSLDFADAIKTVLANNPANSVITLRISAETDTDTGFQRITPKLNISYYDMDLNSDTFFADVKDDLAWDDITDQPIDSVVADLKLPNKFYGYDVTWASDNAAIDESTGEVTVGNEKTAVKLTATITDGTDTYSKAFDVTVSDKAYALDFSNALGSGAKVYVAQDTTAVLVFAAYADSTLLSVAAVDVTLADGENLVNSLLNTTGATEVKLMLVSDMDNLTPLCTYKVK